ncbi:MAG: CBS domain-containing protein, partial [Gemmatimonadota bacterium]|nr:CBS domain-containing protein [Gemmatimonadota bacterium]
TDALPVLPAGATMRQAVVQLAERRGICMIADGGHHLLGVVTTGDLSRLMEQEHDIFPIPVERVMTRTPKVVHADELGTAAVHLMESHGVIALPVLDEAERIVGVVHLHDLMRAGAI